ncbi:20658_t:CDS:2, partial [Gigaspora rosea]
RNEQSLLFSSQNNNLQLSISQLPHNDCNTTNILENVNHYNQELLLENPEIYDNNRGSDSGYSDLEDFYQLILIQPVQIWKTLMQKILNSKLKNSSETIISDSNNSSESSMQDIINISNTESIKLESIESSCLIVKQKETWRAHSIELPELAKENIESKKQLRVMM